MKKLLGVFALVLMIFGVGSISTAAARDAVELDFIGDEGYGAGFSHWQPGQVMLVFWVPEVPDFVYAVTNIQTNVTAGRIGSWVNSCETHLGMRCRIHNLVWLDNPRESVEVITVNSCQKNK